MDGALVVITLVSLGTTSAVLLYAARLIRDERARSGARVTALAEEIARRTGGPARESPAPLTGSPISRRTLGEPAARSGFRAASPHAEGPAAQPDARPVHPRVASDVLGDTPLSRAGRTREGGAPVEGRSGGTLFDSGAAAESPSTRWLVPAIGAAIVVLALVTIYFVSGWSSTSPSHAGRPAGGAVQAPLELVSLRHARDGAALTVSGVVRNPAGATERKEVSAVVFLFGRDGSFLASGRAPLDYQALAAGDESPFAISVSGAGDVSRYRVSFRAGDDVLPHVDRREPAAAARP